MDFFVNMPLKGLEELSSAYELYVPAGVISQSA